MIKWIMENKIKVILCVILLLVVVPTVIYFLSTLPVLPPGGNNDWAGFWGGYLGAIVGGLFTLIVLLYTVSYNEKDKRLEMSKAVIKLASTYNFQIASVIKVSDKYVQSFSQEDNTEMMHACNMVGNASEELLLSMLIYERQYPQLKTIVQKHEEIHWDYMQLIRFIDSEAEDIFEDDIDKLKKPYEDKRDEIFRKVKEFNNVIAATLTEII